MSDILQRAAQIQRLLTAAKEVELDAEREPMRGSLAERAYFTVGEGPMRRLRQALKDLEGP